LLDLHSVRRMGSMSMFDSKFGMSPHVTSAS
jgi:hypothetical protein